MFILLIDTLLPCAWWRSLLSQPSVVRKLGYFLLSRCPCHPWQPCKVCSCGQRRWSSWDESHLHSRKCDNESSTFRKTWFRSAAGSHGFETIDFPCDEDILHTILLLQAIAASYKILLSWACLVYNLNLHVAVHRVEQYMSLVYYTWHHDNANSPK